MDIVVTGRHTHVSDRFRRHLENKLEKVDQIAPGVSRIDVVLSHEKTIRKSECVELTCRAKGSVVRAEATSEDKFAALDAAVEKLVERLRRVNGRRRAVRAPKGASGHGPQAPFVTADAVGIEALLVDEDDETPEGPGHFGAVGDSPIEVREKVHLSSPMTLEDAVNRMELVGHDFFLFMDSETGRPSVVYRRRGWSYGVIHLELSPDVESVG